MDYAEVTGPDFKYADNNMLVLHDQDVYDYIHSLYDGDFESLFEPINEGLNLAGQYYLNRIDCNVVFINMPTMIINHVFGEIKSADLIISIFAKKELPACNKLNLVTVVECTVVFEDNDIVDIVPKFAIQ